MCRGFGSCRSQHCPARFVGHFIVRTVPTRFAARPSRFRRRTGLACSGVGVKKKRRVAAGNDSARLGDRSRKCTMVDTQDAERRFGLACERRAALLHEFTACLCSRLRRKYQPPAGPIQSSHSPGEHGQQHSYGSGASIPEAMFKHRRTTANTSADEYSPRALGVSRGLSPPHGVPAHALRCRAFQ